MGAPAITDDDLDTLECIAAGAVPSDLWGKDPDFVYKRLAVLVAEIRSLRRSTSDDVLDIARECIAHEDHGQGLHCEIFNGAVTAAMVLKMARALVARRDTF
jgi:hypothetical protein